MRVRLYSILTATIAVIATATLVLPSIGFAAPSYTAVTATSNNSVSASYFIVGFYTEDDGNYTPVGNILLDSLEYQKTTSNNVTTYYIEDGTVVSADSLYFKVDATNMGTGSYSVSADCSCTFSNSTESVDAANPSASVVITDPSGTEVPNIDSGSYYGLSIQCHDFSAIMDAEPTSMTVDMYITVQKSCTGVFLDSDDNIAITYHSSGPVDFDPSTPGYEAESSTGSLYGNDYDIITVSNSYNGTGISDADQNVNVSFTMSTDRPFCFEINHVNGENSKLKMTIDLGTGTPISRPSNISGNVHQFVGANANYFGMTDFLNANNRQGDWIVPASDSVSISIWNYDGHVPNNVTFLIVFKPITP